MKAHFWIIGSAALVCVISGCTLDAPSRYYLTEHFPARDPKTVELLWEEPNRPFINMADFQSPGNTPEGLRSSAAAIGADAVIVTNYGQSYGQRSDSHWFGLPRELRQYDNLAGTAIIYQPDSPVANAPKLGPTSAVSVWSEQIKAQFPNVIEFTILDKSKRTPFSVGDGIEITSLRGNYTKLQVGGIYLVEGAYKLGSMDKAILALSVPNKVRLPWSYVLVARGAGHFSLRFRIPNIPSVQSLQIGYYPADGIVGWPHGGIYFAGK